MKSLRLNRIFYSSAFPPPTGDHLRELMERAGSMFHNVLCGKEKEKSSQKKKYHLTTGNIFTGLITDYALINGGRLKKACVPVFVCMCVCAAYGVSLF